MTSFNTSHRVGRAQSGRGFTLIEMLIAVLISSMILLALLAVFDFTGKLARAQTQITDVQQSLRTAQYDVVRLIRMAGRGPLPLRTTAKTMPRGLAVEVINNVAVNTKIGYTADTGPAVVAFTDILVVRGVFGSSLYQVNHVDPASFTRTASGGTLIVADKTPTGVPHDFGPILQTICDNNNIPEALVLVSPLDDAIFAVAELDPAATRAGVTCPPDPGSTPSITLTFKTSGGSYTSSYLGLSAGGVFPAALTSVAFVGILEEHRFYVRQVYADPNDTSSDRIPRFSRARVFPGTDTPYLGNPLEWQNDIADNIFDMQVAIGLDGDGDGIILDQGDSTDEWLFNDPGDDSTEVRWNTVQPVGASPQATRLFNLRLTTVARTGRKDRGYQAPILDFVEDHDYSVTPSDYYNLPPERSRRQRRLQTMIDLRNVS
ncbi:MAG: prepilin-type N-terminal cleavage/methylation domain-containing protein [Acidobacteria bacterium]|nr:prepilin-type N-terminal cleavage/methylation domain-containing protein [Acidobacteriota bacterium]